jgi:hypothetical protein
MFSNSKLKTQNPKLKESPYDPEGIEVVAAPGGEPKAVRVRKRHLQVKGIVNMWRIDEEWWRRPVSRLYFSVEFSNGARMTIFHDLETGQWYRQNWVDQHRA